MRAKPVDASGERAPERKRRRRRLERRAGLGRRCCQARPPGTKNGAVVPDAKVKRPYRPHAPHFPMSRDAVVEKCLDDHLPLECAGEVLALMDLMERRQCTMQHLHDISQVSYATIHELLTLKTCFHTPVRVRLLAPLESDTMEFEWLAHLDLQSLGLPALN